MQFFARDSGDTGVGFARIRILLTVVTFNHRTVNSSRPWRRPFTATADNVLKCESGIQQTEHSDIAKVSQNLQLCYQGFQL